MARVTATKRQRSSMRAQNMQVTAAGAQGAGDRNASVSIPYYSSNPETYTNPIERWRQFVLMYQTSWEARKIVSIPVDDALRKPFVLKGISEEAQQIIKKKMDKLQVVPALKRSLKLERLLGGCLTFMGLAAEKDEDCSKKYDPKVEKAKLHFVNSIPVSRISRMNWDTNPLSENYMRPDSFFVNHKEVHVSRCLVWDGQPLIDPNDFALTNYRANLAGFGSSVLGTLWDDIIMACGTRSAAYQLIQTNNAIIAAVSDLQDLAGTSPGQKNIKKIQDIVNQLSVYRAAIIDGEKVDIKNSPASFGSVPELLLLYLQVLAAASDIPATRFLGQAPGGLNATGDSDLENYYNSIDAFQHERVSPQLMRLIDIIGYAEVTTWEQEREKLEIEWPPLWNETAKEAQERAQLTIGNVLSLVDAALMGEDQAIEEINSRGILSVKLEKDDLTLLGEARDAIDRHLGTEEGNEETVDTKTQIQRLKNMKPSISEMIKENNKHNLDYNEFTYAKKNAKCESCGKVHVNLRETYTADDAGAKIHGYVCDDCLDKVNRAFSNASPSNLATAKKIFDQAKKNGGSLHEYEVKGISADEFHRIGHWMDVNSGKRVAYSAMLQNLTIDSGLTWAQLLDVFEKYTNKAPNTFDPSLILDVAMKMGVNMSALTIDQVIAGAQHEAEHSDVFSWDNIDDREQMVGIALDHLREDPEYYTKLGRVENSAIGSIKRAQGTKKDQIYLDLNFTEREALLEKIILNLPKGARRIGQIRSEVNAIAGTFAETDVTERFIRGLSVKYPKKIGANFTLGLDEVIINSVPVENRFLTEAELADLAARPEPTEKQIESGRYKKGHCTLHGLSIAIENPKGSVRSGRDPGTFQVWKVEMPAHYGYIKKTEGADGDHVDVYIGENPESELVFIVDQVDHATGAFDEHKCILGCVSLKEARDLYVSGFSDGKGAQRIGSISPMHVVDFKKWLDGGLTKQPYGMEG